MNSIQGKKRVSKGERKRTDLRQSFKTKICKNGIFTVQLLTRTCDSESLKSIFKASFST